MIQADFKGLSYPPSFDDYEMEVMGNIPATLGAYEKIIVPYRRITSYNVCYTKLLRTSRSRSR